MRTTLDIMLEGVELSVTGEYARAQADRITGDPYTSVEGHGAHFEVQSVHIGKIDCSRLLEFCYEDIAEKAIHALTI